ncbi:sensor histidine kinase [Arsenicicoccus dermatophilus]|uniref:sensor histidine kinase n=1 Tax=Arsenicicoccus dermatophilus TaxID=1076331 RepID=UPI00391701DB
MAVLATAAWAPRWSLLALVAVLGLSVPGAVVGPGLLALAAVLAGQAARRRTRGLGLTAAAGAVYLLVLVHRLPRVLDIVAWQAVPLLVAVTVGAWVLGGLRRRRHLAEERAARLEQEAQEARAQERRMLARELHDVVAHGLTLVTMQATLLRAADDPAVREQAARTIEVTSRAALRELRALLDVLSSSDAVAERTGAVPDLRETVAALTVGCERLGYPLTAHVDPVDLGPATRHAVDRVLREAVTNLLKHSGPGPAELRVTGRGGDVVITVGNRMVPTGAAVPSGGSGLTGLAERVRLLGGQLDAGPTGDRWVLRAVLPRMTPDDPGATRATGVVDEGAGGAARHQACAQNRPGSEVPTPLTV